MAQTDEDIMKNVEREKRELGIGDDTKSEDESDDSKKDETKDASQKEESTEDDTKDSKSKESETEDETKVDETADKKSDESTHSRRKSPIAEVKDEYKGIIEAKDTEIKALREELSKKNPDKEVVASLEEDIKTYAEELGLKPEALGKIVSLARKGLELPKATLDALDRQAKEAAEAEEVNYFNSEWKGLEPTLKEQYPNATPEQIAKASAEMEKLARHTSEQYAQYELSYILFKHKQDFDKILFTPKKKGLESSSERADTESDEPTDDAWSPSKNGLTPSALARKEAAMNADARRNAEPLKIVDSVTGEERLER